MTDIIDLNERRSANEKPDAACVRQDDYGRSLYLFSLEYEMSDGAYSTEVWAYSFSDAEQRVSAMRESLTVRGQMYGFVPA